MNNSICLNMIVKNESKIITRLLASIVNIIDYYVICDTGSTDDTIQVITDFFKKKGIAGKIIEEPFVDFGVTRTFALNAAKKICNCDYLLFLDADMVLVTNLDLFDKKKLTKDCYSIKQGNESFEYYNVRLISTKLNVNVKSPTHEYYDISGSYSSSNIDSSVMFISDIGDGGSKQNKFKRDIELLLTGIKNEPNNGRYYFYLANTYHDTRDYQNAIKYYNELIRVGSWIEEVFYSYYRLGLCYKYLNDEANMVNNLLLGYSVLPSRVETLYELIEYYTHKGKYSLSNLFYSIAKDIKYPVNCSLFIHKDIYNYKLLEQFTIFAYYIGKRDIIREYSQLFCRLPIEKIYSLFNNYKFYQKIIKSSESINLNESFDNSFFNENYSFVSSTPSIVKLLNGNYLINIRFVNYKIIAKSGIYPYYKNIISINKCYTYSNDFTKIDEKIMDDLLLFEDKQYVGIEDVKLINKKNSINDHSINDHSINDHSINDNSINDNSINDNSINDNSINDNSINDNSIIYTGTNLHKNGKIGVVIGDYSNFNNPKELKNINLECEKNWVFIPNQENKLKMIYKWYPLQIGEVDLINNELIINDSLEMPKIFTQVRGSTNGCINSNSTSNSNEIWFLVHVVHQNNNEPRHYYHMFVVFEESMKLKKYSIPFKFTSGEIEYCTGLLIEHDRFIITHSVWDRESYIKIYDLDTINELFIDDYSYNI